MNPIRRLSLLALAAGLALPAIGVQAQQYPDKPITMIIPFAAGGPTDTVGRIYAQSMTGFLKQQVIVENVGGAGGTLGAARVARAEPNGYTIFLHHIGQSTAPGLYRKLPYNAVDDFSPIGMVADVGTLQRLPKIIGSQGLVRELAYTGRKVDAEEALRIGLVNRVYESREALHASVHELALQIAAKSPLSIRGTKEILNHTRDHSVADGLQYMASWNAAMLMSQDLMAAMMASMSKQTPTFKD